MLGRLSRTEILIGEDGINKLKESNVIVFGIGGVGSYVIEALIRCGVVNITLVDDDLICLTNLNRQLHATHKTVGLSKCEAMKERALTINPNANIVCINEFLTEENADKIITQEFTYIVDAVDTVTAKLAIILKAKELNIDVISCMGTGNKLHPEMLEICDIYKTSICPLAKVMRRELKRRGVTNLKVCYSKEEPLVPKETNDNSCARNCICPEGTKRTCTIRRQIPGSISFVPSTAGLIISGQVVRDIIGAK